MHTLKVFRSPVWLLLHKLSSPHYHYIRKMRRGDRLPLTQITGSKVKKNTQAKVLWKRKGQSQQKNFEKIKLW
jgi:hypothetical protein